MKLAEQALYGPPPERNNLVREKNEIKENLITTQDIYGPPTEPDIYTNGTNTNKNTLNGVNIGLVILLFVIGVIAMVNKKVSKKGKIIIAIITILAMVATTIIIQLIK